MRRNRSESGSTRNPFYQDTSPPSGQEDRDFGATGDEGYLGRPAGRGTHAGGSCRGKGPKGYQRSDQRILEEICDRLTDDDHVDARGIEVEVENGEVLLSGSVPDRATRRRAEDIVEDCLGVTHVQSNLRVSGRAGTSNQRESSALDRDIRQAQLRNRAEQTES